MIGGYIRTLSVCWLLKVFAVALFLSTQLSAMAGLSLGSSLGGGFRTEAGFWERTGNLIDANNRERQMNKAQDEMTGSNQGESKSIVGYVLALLVVAGAGYGVLVTLSSLERSKRNIIIGLIFGIIAALGLLYFLQNNERKNNSEILENKKIANEKTKLKDLESVINNIEAIRSITDGNDKNLIPGSNNLEKMYADYTVKWPISGSIQSWQLERKYITLSCINNKTCGLIESEHPAINKLKSFKIYYCNKNWGLKKKNTEIGNFIVTGVAISYTEDEALNGVVRAIFGSNINLSTDKISRVIDSNGIDDRFIHHANGLSIFWKSEKKSVDLCGNNSLIN